MVNSVTKHENFNKTKASFNVVLAFVRTELAEFRFFSLMFIFFYMFQEEKCYIGFELYVNIYTPREKADFFK